jgi:2-amino-4-hydroxy-6-hydroxymethyldihydropteridine diphosphokinase
MWASSSSALPLTMPKVYVGAGSNADPARALRRAVAELERRFGAIRSSRVYRSAAVGGPAADYLNLVMELATERDVDSVQAALREVELLAGRSRTDSAVCELDLDLLLYGARVDAQRRLPRPGSFTTPFVVGPLAELAPELVNPVTGERSRTAWQRLRPGRLHDVGALGSLR